jgi:hypothetical protein
LDFTLNYNFLEWNVWKIVLFEIIDTDITLFKINAEFKDHVDSIKSFITYLSLPYCTEIIVSITRNMQPVPRVEFTIPVCVTVLILFSSRYLFMK